MKTSLWFVAACSLAGCALERAPANVDTDPSKGGLTQPTTVPDASTRVTGFMHESGGGGECEPGSLRPCVAGTCAGRQECDDSGSWGPCLRQHGDAPEACDGADDDCDGSIDEGCDCEGEEERSCYGADESTIGIAECVAGSQQCVDGGWGPCEGAVLPGAEDCDGGDEDCDGAVDEGCECEAGALRDCFSGAPETLGVGVCQSGSQGCRDGAWGGCDAETIAASMEICDNDLDDDCDGASDEGCVCHDGDSRGCYPGTSATRGVGRCHDGSQACADDVWLTCGGAVLPASEETCDGEVDDDCDGTVDEGCDCENTQERGCYGGPAGTEGAGACQAGIQACASGMWGACTGAVTPTAEQCNGVDDNCNGEVDEGDPGAGASCQSGMPGECAAGTLECGDGELGCKPAHAPAPEQCNGLDDDCNGKTDEDFRDASGAYVSDQHCGGCNRPCGDMIPGSAAETCVVASGGARCEAQGCEPGFYQTGPLSCTPATTNTCASCADDDDCPTPGDRCISVGGAKVCGYDCSAGNAHGTPAGACAEGFTCQAVPGGANQCVPQSGTCGCLPQNDGAKRPCSKASPFGVCGGVEVCHADSGWSSCDAPTAQAEVCDGIDNDCDGMADDGNPGGGASCSTGKPGVCEQGKRQCSGGKLSCVPDTAPSAMDTCGNGLDDNCDGTADEGCCAHTVCEQGASLTASCTPCAATVCAKDPFCCQTKWDALCAERAFELCGACQCTAPLNPEPECGLGFRCRPTESGGARCEDNAGSGEQDDTCEDSDDCAPEYLCARDVGTAQGYCNLLCRVGKDSDCPGSLVCYGFSDALMIGNVEWGVCDVP